MTVRGKKTFRDVSDQAIRNLRRNKVDALIAVGGDGSLTIAYQLYRKGVPVVGIPKTIDNDLWGTDVTFGFNTALHTAMEAIDKIQTTAASHHRVMVVEVMGRYAGWIALEAGIAGGGDVILIPEIPYDIEKVCEVVRERYRYGKRSSIVVVAEGAKPQRGGCGRAENGGRQHRSGAPGRDRLQGRKRNRKKNGAGNPGHRFGPHPAGRFADRLTIVSWRRGTGPKRWNLVMRGRFGRMICLRGLKIDSIPLKRVQNDQRKVFPERGPG